ncbi:MAG: hypothetical protein VCC04_08730 [Myxococcota bacterium]
MRTSRPVLRASPSHRASRALAAGILGAVLAWGVGTGCASSGPQPGVRGVAYKSRVVVKRGPLIRISRPRVLVPASQCWKKRRRWVCAVH